MTVNDIGGQGDPSGGGWEDADDIDTTGMDTDPGDDVEDADPDAEVDDDQDDAADDQNGRRPGREQALRRRAQSAEAERDTLRGQLDATRQSIVDDIARAMRLDSRLLVAGGREVGEFVDDDGHLDRGAVVEAFREVATEFGVRRGIAPNPGQGHRGVLSGGGGVKDTIDKALGRKATG